MGTQVFQSLYRVYVSRPTSVISRTFAGAGCRWQQNTQRFESGMDDEPIAKTFPTAAELTDRAACRAAEGQLEWIESCVKALFRHRCGSLVASGSG